ncbi:hypothetical protein RJT34_03803 [Clitoria ternatea]|uniref:MADS-box domain-containing protein n=1 Tax=Clitoria ternatea TaxID=43366 RepID=A0AAN9KJP3_CLITE
MGRRKIDIELVEDPNRRQITFSKRRTGVDAVVTKFLNQQNNPNETESGSSSKVVNVNKINKQLGNLTKQVSKEENKRTMLDKTAKEITSSKKLSELKKAYATFVKLKKSIDAHVRDVEIAETLIEFSKKPIDRVKRRVSGKKIRN